jgi:hypothetical protein
MTPYEAKAALLASLWFDTPSQAPARAHHDVAIAISAAVQELWSAPGTEAYTRQEHTFPTVGGTEGYLLDDAILRVLGSVRAQGRTLIEVHTLSTFRNLDKALFVRSTDTTPRFYHVLREYAGVGSSEAEAMTLTMLLYPVPATVYNVSFWAAMEPRKYAACDLEVNEGHIPIPNHFEESILIPLARYHLLSSTYLQDPKIREQIAAEGERVRAHLALVEPSQAQRERKGVPAYT